MCENVVMLSSVLLFSWRRGQRMHENDAVLRRLAAKEFAVDLHALPLLSRLLQGEHRLGVGGVGWSWWVRWTKTGSRRRSGWISPMASRSRRRVSAADGHTLVA
jgi:hypothetical protein